MPRLKHIAQGCSLENERELLELNEFQDLQQIDLLGTHITPAILQGLHAETLRLGDISSFNPEEAFYGPDIPRAE